MSWSARGLAHCNRVTHEHILCALVPPTTRVQESRDDGSPNNSSFELFEFLYFLFPLLVLNVQQHVVQRFKQRNPRHRLAASLLQSCNLNPDPPRSLVLENVNVASLLPVLQFFAYWKPHLLNRSACFCPMLTIQNIKRAICTANHEQQQREEMSCACATAGTKPRNGDEVVID